MKHDEQTEVFKRTAPEPERFEFIDNLGKGSAGTVYLVKDTARGGQQVALKLLANEFAFDEHTITRFKDEWAVCQRIRHPNLVESYDLVEYGKSLAFTMEYVPGCDLAKLLKQGRLSYGEVDRIMYQLLDALEALHAANIMHRDIKLENIILRKDGTIKLSDLGLLKRSGVKALTKPGILLGTPQYMPPEYVKSGRFDFRSDVYACGVVMYELLTGQRRLDDKRGAAAISHLVKTNFEFPRVALPGEGQKYVPVLERALSVNPNLRFINAREMQAAFRPKEYEDPGGFSLTPHHTFHFGGGSSHAIRRLKKFMLGFVLIAMFAAGATMAWFFLRGPVAERTVSDEAPRKEAVKSRGTKGPQPKAR